jgi:hypothetical protein
MLPFIPFEFRLLTNYSDETLPNSRIAETIHILNHPFLTKWYCQNFTQIHPKVIHIPIGMDYLTMHNNNIGLRPNWGPLKISYEQEQDLPEPKQNKIQKLFCNFQYRMNAGGAIYERPLALAHIPKHLLFRAPELSRTETWELMSNYQFVVSPAGRGLDCHRTWEALICGCIPIVKSFAGLDEVYKYLPVLIVQNWWDVNETLLASTLEDFKEKTFNMEKLTLKYWTDIIHEDD